MPQALPVITGRKSGTGAVKSLTGGGGSAAGQTTTTQQVDPQTQAMQQDLYRRSQGDCTATVYTLHRPNGCWFFSRPITTVSSY